MAIDFVVGGLARNEDFYFREEFVDNLWESLDKENVLLIAPRRMGKTSVMYCLLDEPRNDCSVVHLNVEALSTPAEFFLSLIDALNEHQPDFLRRYVAPSWDLIKRIGTRIEDIEILDFKLRLRKAEDWDTRWRELAEQLMEKINNSGQHVLFIIDELPDMLLEMKEKSIDDLKSFLHTFRTMRQTPGERHVRWLVGGSVNIRGTLDELGLIKLINDFRVEVLPPWNDEEVAKFISTMLTERNVVFDENIVPHILALLGQPIPLFLQLITQELYRYWRREHPPTLTTEIVDHVYRHALLGESALDKLQHYHSRIRTHYHHDEQEAAYALLERLSLSKDGLREKAMFDLYVQIESQKARSCKGEALKQAFKYLILRLQSDFYIDRNVQEKFDFTSRLLKAWWRRNYGYGAD